MMSVNNKIICFVGPSGVGKTSFTNRLVQKYGFALPKVVTTRQRRIDDDRHYYYVNELSFVHMIKLNLFIEWDKYLEYYYGTLLKSVENLRAKGVILDLTPKGCMQVVEKVSTAIIIALLPDNPKWLFSRLISRNSQTQSEIDNRTNLLQNYLSEIESLRCKKVLVSFSPDSWDKTFKAIENIVFR